MKKLLLITVAAFALGFAVFAGPTIAASLGLDPHYNWVDPSARISNEVEQLVQTQVPYPLAQIQQQGGFAEVFYARERLLRLNDPNAVTYVYIENWQGQPLRYYTALGGVYSTQTQMTTPQQGYYHGINQLIPSNGDNGSFGPEAGGSEGIFFFDTKGFYHETDQKYEMSDEPLSVPGVPNATSKETGKPKIVSSFWKGKRAH